MNLKKYYKSGMDYPILENTENKIVLSIKKREKESTMSYYQILPGIDLIYNSFNSFDCPIPNYQSYSKNIIEINHCKQGRYGCQINDGEQIYLGAGDMGANIHNISRKNTEFPLGFYEGVTILIDISMVKKELSNLFPDVIDNINLLENFLKNNRNAALIETIPELKHVFNEIYSVRDEIKMTYIKLKVLEILLMLQLIPFDRNVRTKKYYSKNDVDKVKMVHKTITENLEQKYTLDEFSKKYNISLTQLKGCFKEVYGLPFYTFLKHYKMHIAAHYLENTDLNINEIAGKLGYDNGSKFISAFKSILNCTPNEYRKQNVRLEHLELFGVEIE